MPPDDWRLHPDNVFSHQPANAPGEIQTLYAFLSYDGQGEGICAHVIAPLGSTPLITAREKLVNAMRPMAQDAARRTGKKVRLVKFTVREVVEEITPA